MCASNPVIGLLKVALATKLIAVIKVGGFAILKLELFKVVIVVARLTIQSCGFAMGELDVEV